MTMGLIAKSIKPFKESRIISKCEKSKRSFVPLYDDRNKYDFGWLANDGSDPKEIIRCKGQMNLAFVYYYSSSDIGVHNILYNVQCKIKDNISYNFMSLYLCRHSIELAMKAFLELMKVDFIKNSHDLLYLWTTSSKNAPTIYMIFEEYDHFMKSDICSNINKFIRWLDTFEKNLDEKGNGRHKGENPYRYLLYPNNKILDTKSYIDVSFLNEYTLCFLHDLGIY